MKSDVSEYIAACFTICILILLPILRSFPSFGDIKCVTLCLPILQCTILFLQRLLLGREIKLDLLGRYTSIERVHS